MKNAIILIPLAFVVGGIVGYWGPSDDLQHLKNAPKVEAKKAKSDGFGAFASLVNIPDAAKRPRRPRKAPEKGASDVTVIQADEAETNAVRAAEPERPHHPRRLAPEDLAARIDEARELWQTRVEMARATAIDKLGLDASGIARFDEAVAAMNEKLLNASEAIAERLSGDEEMTPELSMRMMGDTMTAMAEAYDAIGEATTPEKRAEVSRLEVFNFIDPGVAEPLISVQGKLNRANLP